MGLSGTAAEMLVHEHSFKPIEGDVLLIGRQNVDILPEEMTALMAVYGFTPRVQWSLQAGTQLQGPAQGRHITDFSLFHALGDCKVVAIDVSDYEGAEIIHDLSTPVPDDLKSRFDFIYDGSSLDNIFNGPQALLNMAEMLRPGGRILLFNAINSVPTAYLKFSPDWFTDFFAINGYADVRAYVVEWPVSADYIPTVPKGYPPQGGRMWRYDPYIEQAGGSYQHPAIAAQTQQYCFCIAEKAENSTSSILPVQMHYRSPYDRWKYVEAAKRFRSSLRPWFSSRVGEDFTDVSISSTETLFPVSRWTVPQPTEAERKVQSLLSTKAELEERLKEATQRVSELENSTSWKMTRPLRAVKRIFL